MGQPRLTPDEKALIFRMDDEGRTARDIAEAVGRVTNTIYQFLSRHGRGRGRVAKPTITDDEINEWERLYREGASLREICKRTGRPYRTVRERLNDRGVKQAVDIERARVAAEQRERDLEVARHTVQLRPEVRARLVPECRRRGMTLTELANDALDVWVTELKRNEGVADPS